MATKESRLPPGTKQPHLKRPGVSRKQPSLSDDLNNSAQQSAQSSRDDQTRERVTNTFRLNHDPQLDGAFSARAIENVCMEVLVEQLEDVEYEPNKCRILSQQLAAQIMDSIKGLRIKRHKLVAVVSLGSLKERAALQFGSRCLWNQATDTFATVKFANKSIFAVALVYGMYYE